MFSKKVTLWIGIFILLVVILTICYFGKAYLLPKQYMGNLPVSFSFPATWDIKDIPGEERIALGIWDDPNYIIAAIELYPYDDSGKSSVEILEDAVSHFSPVSVENYLYLTAPHRNLDWSPGIVTVQVIYSKRIPIDIMRDTPIIEETQFVIIEGEQQYALMVFITRMHIKELQEEINLIVTSFRFK